MMGVRAAFCMKIPNKVALQRILYFKLSRIFTLIEAQICRNGSFCAFQKADIE